MPFNKLPSVKITGHDCLFGWDQIGNELNTKISKDSQTSFTIAVEFYQGVSDKVIDRLRDVIKHDHLVLASEAMKSPKEVEALTYPDVTDDRIFGYLSRLNIEDFMDQEKSSKVRSSVNGNIGVTLIVGTGATLLCNSPDMVIYADMARWEIQMRMRRQEVNNIGLKNAHEPFETQYKRGFFVDWRACDRLKKKLRPNIDYWLDTNSDDPKMLTAEAYEAAINQTVHQPFSVVPFFDPGPWGGQWMREKFNIETDKENLAWCFNCVPEENSLLIRFGDIVFETPSINLVFFHPEGLMGSDVFARFGDEFPIRFDFLDTMDGGNLSLQVHPLTGYIQEKFGMHYTQDESYYLLDAKPGTKVYLGLKKGVDKQKMFADLREAQQEGNTFDADKYTESWDAKKHDHFSIPAGTIHCSGKDSMVLEISATPYIFTFKLWDWGRVGMDGKPRPININHGEQVIQWDRDKDWVERELIDQVEEMGSGDGWREERTGLHHTEFIETRRHWFTKKVLHQTMATVNVINLVEGDQAIVESPSEEFEPFIVNYAETFVIPANIKLYTIRPYGESEGKEIATLKAYVRT